jgi:Family of unknown function (DUF5412)
MENSFHQPRNKSVLIPLGVLALILALIIVLCGHFGWVIWNEGANGMCGNEVFQEVYSQDKQYKVIVFERDCGATTAFSTQISILEATQELSNNPGNIFILEGHPNDTQILVEWKDNQTIEITYTEGYEAPYLLEAFKDSSRDFEIRYRPITGK